ncbi:sigma-54-dependent transcriptional regulator [Desulfovibrio subterraneus]|uniref:Fis family transcriptional regulator n=1 Tax=Desulfovibrio subterraneus TaxID=2718620 RepID=A0A7J0BNV8_9BACT|nr:sigma-54 dependent transcriptional regulator [Desulfovibrio subterraneus]GFM34845.1 Fis family transcriptional regulator [Desulfovibrio subterraneus]
MKSIMIICRDETDRYTLLKELANHDVRVFPTLDDALEVLSRLFFDAVFIDLETLSGSFGSPHKGMKEVWKRRPSCEVVVLTPPDSVRLAVDAVRDGAADYLTAPVQPDELHLVMGHLFRSVELKTELGVQADDQWQEKTLDALQTQNPKMQALYEKVERVAGTRSTVLLTGETGTGKSFLARLIHQNSKRRGRQFISVHCGAIPEPLTESELFGHEKGAFTGAIKRKAGKFELAEGGTIFLDEIGTISHATQVKLLSVLQDREFQRVGGEETIPCNVRVIAATNEDLEDLVRKGQFRRDLFYRLNVFPIEVPPLREHREDIPQLATRFIQRSKPIGKEIHSIHPKVLDAFMRYDWPGNVRELENLVERACILETGFVLSPESVPQELFGEDRCPVSFQADTDMPLAEARQQAIDRFERMYLSQLLSTTRGSIAQTAEKAGITTRQLHKLMTRHGLKKEIFK